MIEEYKVPPHGEETHRVVQYLEGRNHPIQEAISVYGDIMCESCDFVLANEGETVKIGHKCKRCQTSVIGFVPLTWRDHYFVVEHDEDYSADELTLIRAFGEALMTNDPENKLEVKVSRMKGLSEHDLLRYGITGKYRLTISMHSKEESLLSSVIARRIWDDVEQRVWNAKLAPNEASAHGILVTLHYPVSIGGRVTT